MQRPHPREPRHSFPPTVAKTDAKSISVLARLEPGLRPRQIRPLGAWESRPSHHLPAWGSISVSTEFRSIHSTHIYGAPFRANPMATTDMCALRRLTSALCCVRPQPIHWVVGSRALQGCRHQREAEAALGQECRMGLDLPHLSHSTSQHPHVQDAVLGAAEWGGVQVRTMNMVLSRTPRQPQKSQTFTLASVCVFFQPKNIWCQHPKHPSLREWVNKRWYIHRMECYIAVKKEQTIAICNNVCESHSHSNEPQ